VKWDEKEGHVAPVAPDTPVAAPSLAPAEPAL
jgi:hypothetical protein